MTVRIAQFKNGNFNIQSPRKGHNLLEDIMYSSILDFVSFGEEQSLGNYDMEYPLYNLHTDRIYYVSGSDIESYKQGNMVKLLANKPDDADRKRLRGEYY